jgi:hypothetical protein
MARYPTDQTFTQEAVVKQNRTTLNSFTVRGDVVYKVKQELTAAGNVSNTFIILKGEVDLDE